MLALSRAGGRGTEGKGGLLLGALDRMKLDSVLHAFHQTIEFLTATAITMI